MASSWQTFADKLPEQMPPVSTFAPVANDTSTAIYRKLGFSLLAECDFEYPVGCFMRCSDWHLDPLAP